MYIEEIDEWLAELLADMSPDLRRRAAAAVAAQCDVRNELRLLYYGALAHKIGGNTTLEQVHDAWALAESKTNPGHPSIRPFDALDPEVQAKDQGYVAAIHRAALTLGGEEPLQ